MFSFGVEIPQFDIEGGSVHPAECRLLNREPQVLIKVCEMCLKDSWQQSDSANDPVYSDGLKLLAKTLKSVWQDKVLLTMG